MTIIRKEADERWCAVITRRIDLRRAAHLHFCRRTKTCSKTKLCGRQRTKFERRNGITAGPARPLQITFHNSSRGHRLNAGFRCLALVALRYDEDAFAFFYAFIDNAAVSENVISKRICIVCVFH